MTTFPRQRDPESTHKRLIGWLRQKLPDATDLKVSVLEMPRTGNSNETGYFDAHWEAGGDRRHERLVLRVQPDDRQLFLGTDVMLQYRMMDALAHTSDVPVPTLFWAEPDAEVLGSPFFVMGYLEGQVAAEVPSYHKSGWIVDLAPGQRHELWLNAMDAFARVARVDWRNGFDFLSDRDNAPGLGTYLAWVRDWFEWAARGRDLPLLAAGLDYVGSRRPDDTAVGIVWGDSRLGNMIIRDDLSVAAVIDWEMAALGPPEVDLGWWVFFDRFLTEGMATPRLDGIPGRDETIAHFESLIGRRGRDVEYYEVLAALRMAIIVLREADIRVEKGVLPPTTTMGTNNPVARILAEHLGLPAPDLAPEFLAIVAEMENS
jgi:aminoglycoside phosphotransferase (APT) family kinase protein